MFQRKSEQLRSSLKGVTKSPTAEKRAEGNKHVTFAFPSSPTRKLSNVSSQSYKNSKQPKSPKLCFQPSITSPRKRQTQGQSERCPKKNRHNERLIRLSNAQDTLVDSLKSAKELKNEAEKTFLATSEIMLNSISLFRERAKIDSRKLSLSMLIESAMNATKDEVIAQEKQLNMNDLLSSLEKLNVTLTESLSELNDRAQRVIHEEAERFSFIEDIGHLEDDIGLLHSICEKLGPLLLID